EGLLEESRQAARADRMAEKLEGVVLDLADPLAGDLEHLGDLLERPGPAGAEAEAHLEDLLLARGQPLHFLLHLLAKEVEVSGLLGRGPGFVAQRIAARLVSFCADGRAERGAGPADRQQVLRAPRGKLARFRQFLHRRLPAQILRELPRARLKMAELLD